MANSFLDRNKKKSSGGLALLLAWLRGRGALVVVLVAVMGLFVAPSNFVGGVTDGLYRAPWGRPLARALSRALGRPEPASYADIVKQLREARQQTNKTAWSLFSRGSGSSNADSLGMVLGGARDVLGAASIGSKIQGGKTIHGVLSPEDSRKNGASGVQLANEELQGGFVASAAAAVFPGQNLLTGGKVAPASPESSMAAAMKQARVPASERMVAGREGKLSKTEFRVLQLNRSEFGQHQSNVGLPGSALYTLADARTRGQMSRAPTCTDDNGCPPEYANTNSGAVYDGNKAGKEKVIQATAVYGFDGASTPGLIKDEASSDLNEVEKIKADQRACDRADATYKPLLNPHVKRMIELSKMPRIPQVIAEQRSECRIMDQLLHQQYDACPLRHEDGPYEPQECD